MHNFNLKDIAERQKEFLKNPRESIIKLDENLKQSDKQLIEKLTSDKRVEEIKLFYDFHKEYSKLIGKLMQDTIISAKDFKDDIFDLKNAQRIKEVGSVLKEYVEKKSKEDIDDTIALKISRLHSSLLEILWGKFKRIIYIKYPSEKSKHLNLFTLNKRLENLEKEYFLDLSLIKSTLQDLLRNKINHETTYFDPPEEIVFLDITDQTKEIDRLTLEEICQLLLKTMICNSAIDHVEKNLIVSWLKLLLKLNDVELNEYCKTGILTKEMQEKISILEKKNE